MVRFMMNLNGRTLATLFRRLPKPIFAIGLFAILAQPALAQQTVKINKPRSSSTYMFELMKLALSYSSEEYQYTTNNETLSRSAQTEAVRNGDLAVMWGGTSIQMEKDFIPVRIDGYRGLMSMRFMLIRDGEQSQFNQIQSKTDLNSIKFGQGKTWTDRQILERSGFEVITARKKKSLYWMLEGGRFDAFPRGATEAWKEAEQYAHLNIAVEDKIIIRYPLPTYFFVNKSNPRLAQDIEAGLEAMLKDGSFDRFFYGNDRIQQFMRNAQLSNRREIQLSNPLLPPGTPLDRKELWLSIDDLQQGYSTYLAEQEAL